MTTLKEQISTAGLEKRIFTDRQLASVVGGSNARRYGLVNRALKDGTLMRLKRGLYLLNAPHPGSRVHPFAIAQALQSGSYISFETALAFHGWIPEAVFATASVTPGRKTVTYEHELLGRFMFNPLALHKYQFLVAVERVTLDQRPALVASPLRALMDLVARRKIIWSNLDWIEQSLRIEDTHFSTLRRKDFAGLSGVYKHDAAKQFLKQFELALFDRKDALKPTRGKHTGNDP